VRPFCERENVDIVAKFTEYDYTNKKPVLCLGPNPLLSSFFFFDNTVAVIVVVTRGEDHTDYKIMNIKEVSDRFP
jgi:hypothetical protein